MCCALVPGALLAHVSMTANTMTVILHINPGDKAQIGKEAVLQFEIIDTTQQFSLEECECTVTILRNDVPIYSVAPETLTKISPTKFHVPYTFTETGTYKIGFAGTSFAFVFDIEADNEEQKNYGTSVYHMFVHHSAHLIIFGLGIVAACYVVFRREKLISP